MDDLISRNNLIEEIKSLKVYLGCKAILPDEAKSSIIRVVDEQPSIQDNIRSKLNELIDEMVDVQKGYVNNEKYEAADAVTLCLTMLTRLTSE